MGYYTRLLGRTRTLESHASRLRRKLNAGDADCYVVNVWGVGYRLLDWRSGRHRAASLRWTMFETDLLELVSRYPHPTALARQIRDQTSFPLLRRLEQHGLVRRLRGHYRLTGRGRDELVVSRHLARLVARALDGWSGRRRRRCNHPRVTWRIDPEGVERRTLAEFAPVGGLHVLELGCGDGRLTFEFAAEAASVYAVDPDEKRIRSARSSLPADLAEKVAFEVAGAAEVRAPRRPFDLALFSWSLWWILGEGVVHALRHVHRLVVPGGTLVDIHPVTEDQVETDRGVVGVIREPEWIDLELPNAEAGLRQTIDEGLYELEAETEYDVLEHFDHPDELIEAKRDVIEGQRELVRLIRATRPPLRTRMHVVFRRLRVV